MYLTLQLANKERLTLTATLEGIPILVDGLLQKELPVQKSARKLGRQQEIAKFAAAICYVGLYLTLHMRHLV